MDSQPSTTHDGESGSPLVTPSRTCKGGAVSMAAGEAFQSPPIKNGARCRSGRLPSRRRILRCGKANRPPHGDNKWPP
eukprot:8045504-Pyramimonas_sp.AAC.1